MNVTASSVAAAPLSVAFIGVGEAGQTFARGLHAEGVRDIRLYDILFDAPQSSLRATASAMANELPGVRLCASHAEAVRGASLVFLAVTAASSLDAARACIPALGAGALLLDINSVSPQRKRETAALVEAGASGARYVDVAVMAAVAKPRHKVPLLIGGPGGEAFAALLPRLGMQGEFVSAEVGEASAVKMCRSIMIKGIEALTVECMLTATHFGVQQRVLASLTETFPSLDWQHISGYMIERVVSHGRRRAEEMREVAETVRGTGLAPLMATATAERQQWMADLGAKEAVRAANGGKSSEDRELLVRVIRDCMTQSATVVND